MAHWSKYLPGLIALIFIGVILIWLFYDPVAHFSTSLPGMDHRDSTIKKASEKVDIGASFTFYKTSDGLAGYNWPRFRGAGFDNISKEAVKLIDRWGTADPRILWKLNLGEGHAAPAVYDGRIYILDYDEVKREDALRCFDLKTGDELWRRSYKVRLKRNHGLSRTIPAVTDKYVLTIGPKCQVMCCDRLSGNFLWGIDLAAEYESEVPFWYTGQCPLVSNDTAIFAVGGKSLLIAVDCKTGKKVWETPNPHHWKMSHSSVMPMEMNGVKSYIYFAIGGICAVAASGSEMGSVLWETTGFAPAVVAPSPVVMKNGYIFVTAGYGAGAALLKVDAQQNGVRIIQQYKPSEGLASEQQTPVYIDGYLYGILPKDAGNMRNQFVVVRSEDTRKVVSTSGKEVRFGLGPYIYADGKFYILNDDGEMTIARISPSGFSVLDRKKIIEGQDSWGPLAITGGYLLMRDSKTMVCLDIRAK